jgi:hypothetical protein
LSKDKAPTPRFTLRSLAAQLLSIKTQDFTPGPRDHVENIHAFFADE